MFKRKTQLDGKFILNFVMEDLPASMATYVRLKRSSSSDLDNITSLNIY